MGTTGEKGLPGEYFMFQGTYSKEELSIPS